MASFTVAGESWLPILRKRQSSVIISGSTKGIPQNVMGFPGAAVF
jgi:hypothetical protein